MNLFQNQPCNVMFSISTERHRIACKQELVDLRYPCQFAANYESDKCECAVDQHSKDNQVNRFTI